MFLFQVPLDVFVPNRLMFFVQPTDTNRATDAIRQSRAREAMSPFFETLAFYSQVEHHAELGAILLAGFMTLAYFAERV
jgi:hypothetical protein